MTRLFLAFLRRDVLTHLSYRLDFGLKALSILFYVTIFYFISQLIGTSGTQSLEAYGGNYFSFVLVGMVLSLYQAAAFNAFSQCLREEQTNGTLESVLATPIGVTTFLLASAQWDLLNAFVEAGIYFLIGLVFFGLKLPSANLPAALLMLGLAIGAFTGQAILSAAFILRFKRGDPISWLAGTVSELLGGVFFPIAILPVWLKRLSPFIPLASALEGFRKALFHGSSIAEIMPQILILLAFTFVLLPLGIFCFSKSLESAKREGSLGHY